MSTAFDPPTCAGPANRDARCLPVVHAKPTSNKSSVIDNSHSLAGVWELGIGCVAEQGDVRQIRPIIGPELFGLLIRQLQ